MPNNQELISRTAKELVEKYGNKAIEIAKRKVNDLQNQHSRESDLALQILSEVEKLLENN